MKRSEVRIFAQQGVNNLTPALDYSEGLITDWNAQRSNQYPGVMFILEEVDSTIESTNNPPNDTWKLKFIIANQDKLDSTPDLYENIIDQCDLIAQKLVYQYRVIVDGNKLTVMEGLTRKRFVKKYADCLTGIELTFELIGQDVTNVC